MLVIGIQNKTGEYNGLHYNNYYLHCVDSQYKNQYLVGNVTKIIKIKSDLFQEFLDVNKLQVVDVLNKKLKFNCNFNGTVISINLA